ncbi:hypothetical protein HXX76_000217 [Chlamydomonas incerta]|uniref:Right handed beta helix domain-containing protein n=1 Tax=Chlamydomonas incerta TaxID=51695 RepID=A0A835WE53_CHLIN|nr:hypothetical protein HXX76_000217 [Chlamydomonas incerta]|eukprot:KAG2445606.1 hypothetical protein HXX76_000217 [Chlamydomonas incerta]
MDNTTAPFSTTFLTSISTQNGLAAWNYMNGATYYQGSTDTHFLGDTSASPYGSSANPDKFRTLLRFEGLHKYIPDGAVITAAELSLTFINWRDAVQVQACFMNTSWDYSQGSAPRFQSTGWAFAGYNTTAGGPRPWSQPGAWADCDTRANISFVVPGNGAYGYVSQTLALDPRLVAGWLAGGGSRNFGLLFRGLNDSLGLVGSAYTGPYAMTRRPALSLTYGTAAGVQPPNVTYPVKLGAISRIWYVATYGSDETGSGHTDLPFRYPAKAVFEAWPGDRIFLKTGAYPGALNIERAGITLQSAPGHWAVLSLPMDDPQNAVNVITVRPNADYLVIQNLEVTGGFYYGIMFFTTWENYGTVAERSARGRAATHALIQNVRIHDTGSSGVKLVMKATNVTFKSCEIHNTGARLRVAGHGIEAVQAHDVTVRDCYLHDIPGAGVHLAGGSARALLERNYVERTGFGFNLGFDTDSEYFDVANTALYESINATARNNILVGISMAGINVWAGYGAVIAHNTLWHTQATAQASILLAATPHDNGVTTPCANTVVWGNLLVREPAARAGPVFQIRAGGLDAGVGGNGSLVMAYNVYYDQAGLGGPVFQWGKGAMLEDERPNSTFVGNASGWAAHCSAGLRQAFCDVNSTEADPRLGADFSPLFPCSPAVRRAGRSLPGRGSTQVVIDDFYGRKRPSTGSVDAGAVQSANVSGTPLKAVGTLPPVPVAFAARAPYKGTAQKPVYDKQWPYDFWRTRACKDLVVDAVTGTDDQTFVYDSSYTQPFKTIQAALININQCDRIVLRAQTHAGGFGIYRPNVTISTYPADLAAGKRALVVCNTTGDRPCIRTGDGFYGGAAAINLNNFDVSMSGGATGSCIHLNEGAGSGTSAYWAWYLTTAGKTAVGPRLSYIQNMALTGCGLHGIKLSTFIYGVVMQNLVISSPAQAGIEVRGGGDLTIRQCNITSAGETAIRLGGGARNCLVERNYIKDFGGRGILLGSDKTEVAYMNVDWARSGAGSWHDNINSIVRNNILHGGAGAGIAFYSARDAVVVHNTLIGVAASMQAGVLLNLSPKLLSPLLEVAAPNLNITFKNNIVVLGGPALATLVVEARIMQASLLTRALNASLPQLQSPNTTATNATGCPAVGTGTNTSTAAGRRHRHLLRAAAGEADVLDHEHLVLARHRPSHRRQLGGMPFAEAYINAPGEQGRNADGSCPLFPRDHAWHQDVRALPLHPNGDAIRAHIGGGGLHPDFGGGYGSGGKRVLYGIPYLVVDSSRGTPLVKVDIGPYGYPSESDRGPNSTFPFPPDTPVEGAYANCPDATCGGDRHILVVDNATCLLYEAWRSFPPSLNKTTNRWTVDILARFNLSRNALGRPLGWSSADAAGLAILPGLVRYEEIVRGYIDHAIRFTGPNSRAAYVPPATHFAPAGYTGPDAPPMGLRVRLNASYDCSPLKRAARIVCTALKTYGGIFADNGSPWYFSGEATAQWDAVLSEVQDIKSIPSAAMEVLDTGCYCIDADCTLSECGGVPNADPSALAVYTPFANTSALSFANNFYYRPASSAYGSSAGGGGGDGAGPLTSASGRFVDRRAPPLGLGYDGGLAGWQAYLSGDAGSVEGDPKVNVSRGYRPASGSPAIRSVPLLATAADDYHGKPRGAMGNLTDAGAALS